MGSGFFESVDESFKHSRFDCSNLSCLGRNTGNLDGLCAARKNKAFTTNLLDWLVSQLWCLDDIYTMEDLKNG